MLDLEERMSALLRLEPILEAYREAQRCNPRPLIEMAIVALEMAREELLGRKPD